MKTPHTAPPRDHLEAVGQSIYGDSWKAPMARELKVDLRTLRRWASDASDLAWDHGAIADLRAVVADEHAGVLASEIELRETLNDLDDAILYRRLRVENGDREPVNYFDTWSDLFGWQPPTRPSTLADYAALVGRLKGQLDNEIRKVRDLEIQIAVLQKPKGMHFNISAGELLQEQNGNY